MVESLHPFPRAENGYKKETQNEAHISNDTTSEGLWHRENTVKLGQ